MAKSIYIQIHNYLFVYVYIYVNIYLSIFIHICNMSICLYKNL